MKAIAISRYGGPEVLTIAELPDPVPVEGEVLIRVEAFGLNHAELYMRSGAWGDMATVTGIECAGIVEVDRSGRLAPGTSVVAIMGGMGRTRNGSYAELVTVPAGNVIPVETSMSWTDLVAVPEVYATAWCALHDNLDLQPKQTVMVRGATSAVGRAAVNLALAHGATVIGTTRNAARQDQIRKLGATTLIDDGALADQIERLSIGVDAVFDLVGNSVLRDSLRIVRPRGRVCQVGFLGGQDPVDSLNPIVDLPTGVQMSFFGSFELGTEHFPLSAIPVADIIADIERGRYQAKPSRTFGFDQVVEAHQVMEANQALGKMVVAVR